MNFRFCGIGNRSGQRFYWDLFSNAKRAKNRTENLFYVGFSDDFTDRIERGAQFQSSELRGFTVAQPTCCSIEKLTSFYQRVFVTGVDRDQVCRGENVAAAAQQSENGIAQSFDAVAGFAGSGDAVFVFPRGIDSQSDLFFTRT